jgi:rare lipoprotein A
LRTCVVAFILSIVAFVAGCAYFPHTSIYWGGFELGAAGDAELLWDGEASGGAKTLTVTHPTIAPGGFARVTNRDTGRALIARVIAQGADADTSRISAGAAARLGIGQDDRSSGYVEEIVAQVGPASWYGKAFHGRPTASGETYDQNAMTAAHRFLPFGTWVRITAEATGRSAVARINDRGGFIKGRVIDVSKRVAERVGFRDRGIAIVRVEALRDR